MKNIEKNNKIKNLALFDFDGTISTKNSFKEFLIFVHNKPLFYFKIIKLLPYFLTFKLRISNPKTIKVKLITEFLKGITEEEYKRLCIEFFNSKNFKNIIKYKAIESLVYHKQQNNKIIIVSASIEGWLKHFCEEWNIELISTKIEIKENIITGNILGLNCFGENKVKLIEEKCNLKEYKNIYVYGDSIGDKEMLKLASKGLSFYKPFN